MNVWLLAVRRCGRYAERAPRFFLGVLKKSQIGVSLWNSAGELLTRWGGEDTLEPGNLCIPHAICVDSRGDIYVGDLPGRGMMPTGYNTLQKFARVV